MWRWLSICSRVKGELPAHDRDAVPALLTDAGADRHVGDFIAASDYLKTLDNVDGERMGMIGFCFGGGITWRSRHSIT